MARSVSFCAGFYTAVGSYPYIRRGDLQEYIRIFPTPALPPFTINDTTFHGTHGLPRQTQEAAYIESCIHPSIHPYKEILTNSTLGPSARQASQRPRRPARQPGQPGRQASQAASPARQPETAPAKSLQKRQRIPKW